MESSSQSSSSSESGTRAGAGGGESPVTAKTEEASRGGGDDHSAAMSSTASSSAAAPAKRIAAGGIAESSPSGTTTASSSRESRSSSRGSRGSTVATRGAGDAAARDDSPAGQSTRTAASAKSTGESTTAGNTAASSSRRRRGEDHDDEEDDDDDLREAESPATTVASSRAGTKQSSRGDDDESTAAQSRATARSEGVGNEDSDNDDDATAASRGDDATAATGTVATRSTRASSTRSAATSAASASSRTTTARASRATTDTATTTARTPRTLAPKASATTTSNNDGTPVSSTSTMSSHTTLRRSTRKRETRQIYGSTKASSEKSLASSSSRKNKRAIEKKKKNDKDGDDDDDDSDDDRSKKEEKAAADPEESMDEDEEEEESSSDDDDDDEEEFTPAKQATTTRKRKSSPEDGDNKVQKQAQRPTPKQAAKATKGSAASKKKAAAPKKSRRISVGGGGGDGGVGVAGTATQKTIKGALQRMATTLLKRPDETPETSLFAALLASHTSDGDNKKKSTRRSEHDDDDSDKQSMYTPQLQEIARRVILEHHEDPNKAQVDLYNILVRAVGGSVDSLLDPDEIELGHLEEADLDTFTESLLDDMRDRPLDEILFSADPLGAAHAEGVKRSAAGAATIAPREFRKIFEEFWYLIGVAALSTSAPTGATSKSKSSTSSKTRSRRAKQDNKVSDDGSSMEEDSADDADDDDDSANITQAGNSRKQVEMIKEITNHMVEMSAFPIADLRAGTTIAVYRLLAAMLAKTVELNSQISVSKRQLAIAKKNNMAAKAKALKGQLETWQQTKEALESFVTETGLGVFIQRYMDSSAFIRADSIDALCQFTLIRPDLFMASKFTKYFGYTLCDKDAVVRRSAVRGIIATSTACEDEQYEPLMAKFAEKFVPERLAAMTQDPDASVQEGTMKILNLLLDRGLLDDIEDETIWYKINLRALDPSASPALRRDALRFVLEQLEAFDKSSKRDLEANAVTQIKAVVQWVGHVLSEQNIPINCMRFHLANLVIESMRACPEHRDLATNFNAMLRALNNSSETIVGETEEAQQKRQEEDVSRRVLLQMLVAAVEMEVLSSPIEDSLLAEIVDGDLLECHHSNEQLSGETGKKKNKNKKAASQSSSARDDLTLALLRSLPDLMESFKTEPAIVRSLTTLPQYFSPSILNLANQKKNFTSLVRILLEVFMESADEDVVGNCCLSLTYFAEGDHARSGEVLVKLSELVHSLRKRLLELLQEKASLEDSSDDNDDDDENDADEKSKNAVAISLYLKRLAIVGKRWSIAKLLETDGTENGFQVVEELSTTISAMIAKDLSVRATPKNNDDDMSVVPEIWRKRGTREQHSFLADTIGSALSFLLSTASWKLEEFEEDKNYIEGEEGENSLVSQLLHMRERIRKVLLLCFEQFLEEEDRHSCSEAHLAFSQAVQRHASRAASELRALFPKLWSVKCGPVLKKLAFSDDNDLVGANVRFLDSELRNVPGVPSSPEFYRSLLIPFSRGLLCSWELGNRREGVVALSNITSSNPEILRICETTSKIMMKLDPVRFLEAQLVSLRDAFDDWLATQPDELEDESPREEELDAYDATVAVWEEQGRNIELQAERLSAMLEKGSKLETNIVGFIKAGIDLSMGGEYGSRLQFLTMMSKYLKWISKGTSKHEFIRMHLNAKERELRQRPDFEEAYPRDLEALDEFRKKGKFGDFPIDDESTVGGGDGDGGTAVTDHDSSDDDDDETRRSSGHRRPRMSMASSVSSIHSRMSQLSPVLEEGATAAAGGGGGDTIKATKRQKLSAEEMAIAEANEEESDSDETMDEC